jgi:type II secretory pathway component PulK
MKINHPGEKSRRSERGLATVFVLMILGIMAILISSNTGSLRNLNGHLQLIEEQQLKQHESRPGE